MPNVPCESETLLDVDVVVVVVVLLLLLLPLLQHLSALTRSPLLLAAGQGRRISGGVA